MTFFRIFEYLRYRWQAKNAHGVHSPFVFDFYNQVLRKSVSYPKIKEQISQKYLSNQKVIQFEDPKTHQNINTSVQKLARRSWSGKTFSFFLLKLCEWLEAKSFMETGTSLGITLSVVGHARGLDKLYSIEGSKRIADMALELNFVPKEKDLKIIHGTVRDTFEKVLKKTKPEVVFLDADHRSETISFYMSSLKKHGANVQAIVIHDIYWSIDMAQAWRQIINDPVYPLTIDCYHMGIVFPQVEMEKQHFVLKY